MEQVYDGVVTDQYKKNDEKIVVVHQPDFLPWSGFFDRLLNADIYVVFDNVQFVSGSSSWMNRDKIKTQKGAKWITVGVKKCPRETPINEVLLSKESNWREDNLNQIRENYKNALYYSEIMPYIEELYSFRCDKMMDFNLYSIKMLMKLFDIQIETVFASSLDPKGKNNTLIVDIVKKLGCRKYLSGTGARDYFDPEVYEKAGVEVIWQDYSPPVYPQQFGEFIPYMSSIDMFFNCGIEESRRILRQKE